MPVHDDSDEFIYKKLDVDPAVLLDNIVDLFDEWWNHDDDDDDDDDDDVHVEGAGVYELGRRHAVDMCIRTLREVLYAKAPLTGEQLASLVEESTPAQPPFVEALMRADRLDPDLIVEVLENLVQCDEVDLRKAQQHLKKARERLARARRLHPPRKKAKRKKKSAARPKKAKGKR